MPLESLLELVETLQNRIDEHGTALRQSEVLTRAALIDPLLRELGWDTEDPALVMHEYRLGRGYADYALLHNGKPVIMVEAKKLGTPLHEVASQGIGYCIEDGIGYFAVTDGGQWEIYETHKMAPIAEKLTVQFDIEQSSPMTCLKAMALWRHSVKADSARAAQLPVIQVEYPGTIEVTGVPTPKPPPVIEPEPDWILLSDFRPKTGVPSTVDILFPDNSIVQLAKRQWYRVTTETILWLYQRGHLSTSNCRVQKSTRYIVSDSPTHPNGKDFIAHKKAGPFYVERNYSGLGFVINAEMIIKHVGLDPTQFKVRLR